MWVRARAETGGSAFLGRGRPTPRGPGERELRSNNNYYTHILWVCVCVWFGTIRAEEPLGARVGPAVPLTVQTGE